MGVGVDVGLMGRAVGMFAVTNIDDIPILTMFFAQTVGHRGGAARVVIGQCLGFAAILAASINRRPRGGPAAERVIPYLGLLPVLLGVRAAWKAVRERNNEGGTPAPAKRPGILPVMAVTFANGGDNIGVYVPVFGESTASIAVYMMVFLILLGVWCLAGRFFTTRPMIARALSRWGHIVLPAALVGIGLLILIRGGAFGL